MQAKEHGTHIVNEFIRKKGQIDLPAHGTSMWPLIQEDDICRFVAIVDLAAIKKGDIVLFESKLGKLVAHRLISTKLINNQMIYLFKGDSNLGQDEPVGSNQLLGKLTNINKKNLILTDKNWITRIWNKVILWFPILSTFIRAYLNRRIKEQLN